MFALLMANSTASQADRITSLSERLSKGSSEKARVTAAASLGKSKDKRALRPLVLALRDKNVSVRQMAASALGRLGDARALPALRKATRDSNASVRKRATQAIGIIRHNTSASTGSRRVAHFKVNGRETPRLKSRKPTALLSIRSSADDTKGRRTRKKARLDRAAKMKSLMLHSIASTNHFTSNESVGSQYKLPLYNLDLSIVRLDRIVNGPWVELQCEIRVAISNKRGKMISFLTGGAKVQLPKRTFRPEFEANMRKEALENAVRGIHADLLRYLVKKTGV